MFRILFTVDSRYKPTLKPFETPGKNRKNSEKILNKFRCLCTNILLFFIIFCPTTFRINERSDPDPDPIVILTLNPDPQHWTYTSRSLYRTTNGTDNLGLFV